MNLKIKIVLAENSELFRKSLVSLLNTEPQFEVVGEANNGKELLDLLKQKQVDIVLLDVEMPVMDGRVALDIMQKRFPHVKVIVLSIHNGQNFTTEFMSLGASCVLSKNCGVDTMFSAIRTVNRDGYYFDNTISKAMLGALIKDKAVNRMIKEVVFNARETEILKAICDGKTNKEIASSLHLSASTIDFHRCKIYAKANCGNVTGLLKYALRNGIVSLT